MNHFIAIVLRHWKPVAMLNVLIMGIALLSASRVEQNWAADAKLILPNSTSDLNLDLGNLGALQGGEGLVFSPQLDSRQILASIMMSDDSVRLAWEQDPEKEIYPRLGDYRNLFNVEIDSTSTILSLSAEGSTPDVARDRLSSFIDAFQERLKELRSDDVLQRSDLVQQSLVQAQAKLAQAEQNLVEFQERSNLVNSESQTTEQVAAINTLRLNQGAVLAQFEASQTRLSTLSARLNQTPDQAILALNLSEDEGYQSIQTKLAELNVELLEQQALFTNDHPQVKYLLTQRDELLRQQRDYIISVSGGTSGVNPRVGQNYATLIQELILTESDSRALRQQASQLQSQLEQMSAQLQQLPSAQARLAKLQREYDISEGLYNALTTRIQANQVNAFSTYPSVQILDQPAINPKPIGPGRKPIAVGAFLASIFGSVALILFLENRNPLLASDDLKQTTLFPLGQIPLFRKLQPGIDPQIETELAFQHLAVTVSKIPLEQRCLVVSSAIAGEGKTTVTLGLAIALSKMGFHTLLVNGDPYNNTRQWLERNHSSSELSNNKPAVEIRPDLDVLTIGSKSFDGETLLTRGYLEKQIQVAEGAHQYDYILVDTAPISSSYETNLIVATIPNILLVVRPGTSYRKTFQDSLNQLAKSQARILGVVLNGVGTPTKPYAMEKEMCSNL